MRKNKQVIVPISPGRVFDKKIVQSDKKGNDKGELGGDLNRAPAGTGRIVSLLVIFAILIYQNTLRFMFPPSCRFHPSCSEYAIQALKKFGLIKGGWLSVKRLSKCHPLNPGGFDPIP